MCSTRSIAAALILSAVAGPASSQTLESRIGRAPDGTAVMSFPSLPWVCGDGEGLIAEQRPGALGFTIYSRSGTILGSGRRDLDRCEAGPIRVRMRVRGGAVRDLEVSVGPVSASASERGTDLGAVDAQEAALFLLSWSRNADEDGAHDAMLAAALAADVEIAADFVRMGADTGLRPDVRERALRWAGRRAFREGYDEGAVTLRDIAVRRTDVPAVRERAIRVLADFSDGDRVLRAAYGELERDDLRERAVRVMGEFEGAETARWLEAVVRDEREDPAVRERAVRVLGGSPSRARALMALFADVTRSDLKERIVRVVGEDGGGDVDAWLQQVAGRENERIAVRERALRVLGERGASDALREAFPRMRETALRERIVRVVGERGTSEDMEWLARVAADAGESSDVSERAVRVLGESPMSTERLAGLYDRIGSISVRERLLRVVAARGDDASLDRLMWVVENEPSRPLRERALKLLSQSGDERAEAFLERRARR